MFMADEGGALDSAQSLHTGPPTRLRELYYDPRSEHRPSRFLRSFLGNPGSTTAISRNVDGTRCVVAGKEALKIVRFFDSSESSAPTQRRSSKVLANGAGGLQLTEESNLWAHSRPPASYSMTDVSWGSGVFSSKIITSCSTGDVILWDINRPNTKIERIWREEHLRAVNKIMFSPFFPHIFLTGSQDTHVKIWDMRTPNGPRLSLVHSTAVRSLAMSPTNQSLSNQILVALEGGDLLRWDLRSAGRQPQDKIAVAHRGAILGMDWSSSASGEDGKGWICTGGQDRTVKVWDMSQPSLSSTPKHILHTPHPVKRVKWRPNNHTEIVVVPRTIGISPFGIPGAFNATPDDGNGSNAINVAVDPDRMGIWDVRRHYVSKYILLGGEGAIADAAWTGSDTLCAVYKSGCLTQHDIQHSYIPVDYMPRHAVSWDPMGGISFITGKRVAGEVPYDDVSPATAAYVAMPPKTPAEGAFESSQAAGFYPGPVAEVVDLHMFRDLARGYMLHGDNPINMCRHNSDMALNAEDYLAAQMWDRLQGLLTDPIPLPSLEPSPPRQHSVSRSNISSISFTATSEQIPVHRGPPRGPERSHRRRASSIGRVSNASTVYSNSRAGAHSRTRQTQTSPSSSREGSPSPSTELRRRNGLIPATIPSINLKPAVSTRSSPRSRGSIAQTRKGPQSREASRSGARSRSLSMGSAAALMALQDDSGSADSDEEDSFELRDDEDSLVFDSGNAPPSSPVIPTTTGVPMLRSPLSQSVVAASSLESESPVPTPNFSRPDSPQDSEASERGAEADDNYYTSSSPDIDSPMHRPFNGNGKQPLLSVPNLELSPSAQDRETPGLPRQSSESSIKTTVPAKNMYTPSPLANASGVFSRSAPISHNTLPSPTTRQSASIAVSGESHLKGQLEDMVKEYPERGRKHRQEWADINAAQIRLRELGWEAFRQRVEEEIENGNIQLAASLAVVGGDRVLPDPGRVEQLTTAYVDILTKLRLHTSAAMVRKGNTFDSVKDPTTVDTAIHMACGKCRKPFLGPPPGSRTTISPGQYQFCSSCREPKARCAICRLPVQGLLFFCQVCAHGGHQQCYRNYLLARPLIDDKQSPERPTRSRGSWTYHPRLSNASGGTIPVTDAADSGSPSVSTTLTEDDDNGELQKTYHSSWNSTFTPPSYRRKLRYHPCPTGCGHSCWAANDGS